MNKFALLFGHGFVSYLFSILLGFVLLFSGVSGLIMLNIKSMWMQLAFLAVAIFIGTTCSACIFSKNFSFTKKDVRFVLIGSLIFGLLIIYSGASGEFEDTRVQVVTNNIFTLAGYLLGTFLFLKPTKNIAATNFVR